MSSLRVTFDCPTREQTLISPSVRGSKLQYSGLSGTIYTANCTGKAENCFVLFELLHPQELERLFGLPIFKLRTSKLHARLGGLFSKPFILLHLESDENRRIVNLRASNCIEPRWNCMASTAHRTLRFTQFHSRLLPFLASTLRGGTNAN